MSRSPRSTHRCAMSCDARCTPPRRVRDRLRPRDPRPRRGGAAGRRGAGAGRGRVLQAGDRATVFGRPRSAEVAAWWGCATSSLRCAMPTGASKWPGCASTWHLPGPGRHGRVWQVAPESIDLDAREAMGADRGRDGARHGDRGARRVGAWLRAGGSPARCLGPRRLPARVSAARSASRPVRWHCGRERPPTCTNSRFVRTEVLSARGRKIPSSCAPEQVASDPGHPANPILRHLLRPRPSARAARRYGPRRVEPLSRRAKEQSERIDARFESPLHDEWVASVLGITLGVAFTVCFLTASSTTSPSTRPPGPPPGAPGQPVPGHRRRPRGHRDRDDPALLASSGPSAEALRLAPIRNVAQRSSA